MYKTKNRNLQFKNVCVFHFPIMTAHKYNFTELTVDKRKCACEEFGCPNRAKFRIVFITFKEGVINK